MLTVPAIDIMGGKVVRLEKGEFQRSISYELSPLEFAKKWKAEGASFLHIVDLDGAREGEPRNFDIIADIISRVPLKAEVGGGIRCFDTVKKYLKAGVERVVLSTKIIEDASFLLTPEVKEYLDRVVVSIDIRFMESPEVATATTGGWLKAGDVLIDIPSFLQSVTKAGVRYVNFSDISRDGMMTGPDTNKILNFLKMARGCTSSKLYFTYAGGISSLEDIKALKAMGDRGPEAVIIGRALYEKKFSLKEAIDITC